MFAQSNNDSSASREFLSVSLLFHHPKSTIQNPSSGIHNLLKVSCRTERRHLYSGVSLLDVTDRYEYRPALFHNTFRANSERIIAFVANVHSSLNSGYRIEWI